MRNVRNRLSSAPLLMDCEKYWIFRRTLFESIGYVLVSVDWRRTAFKFLARSFGGMDAASGPERHSVSNELTLNGCL